MKRAAGNKLESAASATSGAWATIIGVRDARTGCPAAQRDPRRGTIGRASKAGAGISEHHVAHATISRAAPRRSVARAAPRKPSAARRGTCASRFRCPRSVHVQLGAHVNCAVNRCMVRSNECNGARAMRGERASRCNGDSPPFHDAYFRRYAGNVQIALGVIRRIDIDRLPCCNIKVLSRCRYADVLGDVGGDKSTGCAVGSPIAVPIRGDAHEPAAEMRNRRSGVTTIPVCRQCRKRVPGRVGPMDRRLIWRAGRREMHRRRHEECEVIR
jgi:hypothetical protein